MEALGVGRRLDEAILQDDPAGLLAAVHMGVKFLGSVDSVMAQEVRCTVCNLFTALPLSVWLQHTGR